MKKSNKWIEAMKFKEKDRKSLSEVMNQLYREASFLSRKELITIIKFVTEKYVLETGAQMDHQSLEQLGTLLLREELMDHHPDKMSRTEYPIMSDYQYKRRLAGEVFNHAFNIGTGVLIGHRALHYVSSEGQSYHGMQAMYRYPK